MSRALLADVYQTLESFHINSNVLSRSIRKYLPAASRLPKLCGEKPSVVALVHCSVRSPTSQARTYP